MQEQREALGRLGLGSVLQQREGAGGVSENAHRPRAAYVERVGVATCLLVGAGEGGGDPGQGLVEVVEVLPVAPQAHVGHAGVIDRVGVEGRVTAIEGLELGELALLGMEPEQRLVEESLESDGTDLVRDVVEHVVEMGAHVVGLAEYRLGDPTRPPGLDLAGDDPRPDPGEPMAQHQGVADHCVAASSVPADRSGERGGCLPRQPRDAALGVELTGPFSGRVVGIGGRKRLRVLRQHRVRVCPLGSQH